MKYEHLTEDEQKERLKARLHQLEAEHFDHTVNLANAEALGEEGKEAAEQAKEALAVIDQVYASVKTQAEGKKPKKG